MIFSSRILLITLLAGALISFTLPGDSTKIIYLHIVHGSKPKAPAEYRSIGGYYGGHTVIQIDTFLYGFNFNSKRIHTFPHKRKSSGVFEKESLTKWKTDKKKHKVTSIEIPVTHQQHAQLKAQYEEFEQHPPHDYAFFGMRCAASSYYMLGIIGVVPSSTRTKSICKAFHPKMLRKRMVKLAGARNYKIKVQKGSYTRKWEGE